MSIRLVKKAKSYIGHYGIKTLIRKAIERKSDRSNYDAERRNLLINDEEKERQRKERFGYEPVISIILPAYNTETKMLSETLMSVRTQTYEKWELCISDGGEVAVEETVRTIFPLDERVKYIKSTEQLGLAQNSNEAIGMATGDYVAFLDHDDLLEPDALYEVVKAINLTDADMVYTDEDKVNEDTTKYFRPYNKPDYNEPLFWSNNYICHFCAIRSSIVKKLGGFRAEYDGAQDYDLFLRITKETKKIAHVAKVLYHWRVNESSTSGNPFNKEYAKVAGKKALEAHFERMNIPVEVHCMEDMGYYKASYSGDVCVDDYELVLEPGMEITSGDKETLVRLAMLTGSDIVVPKIIHKKKYVYGGIDSLKGKPAWYRGRFNLGITPSAVTNVPKSGYLRRIGVTKVEGAVYEPSVTVTIKGKYNEKGSRSNT